MDDRQRKLVANKLIVALDVDTIEEALAVVDRVGSLVTRYKIGSRMFTAFGPRILTALEERGKRVFLDLKYHDIPSVVGDAIRIVATEHPVVFLVTVHASGGGAMVSEAVENAALRTGQSLEVVAVTALTSLSPSETRLLGVDLNLETWVVKLGELALDAGAHGLVCSPNEVANIRERFGRDPTIVTPGVRPAASERLAGDDQARTATPAAAIDAGSTYLVMGRPIVLARDPRAVVEAIGESL